jgi:putative membrane protein
MFYGDHMGGWGYGFMTIGMALFWASLIVGVLLLARYLGRTGRPDAASPRPAPEQLLAERFARGEIDTDEYVERLEALLSGGRPTAT